MTTQKWLVAAVLSLCVASPSLVHAQVPEDKPLPIIPMPIKPQHLLSFKTPVEYQDMVNLLRTIGFSEANIARATNTSAANDTVYKTLDLGQLPTLIIEAPGATRTFSFTGDSQIKAFTDWAWTLSQTDAARLNQEFQIHLKTASGVTQQATFGDTPAWADDFDSVTITVIF